MLKDTKNKSRSNPKKYSSNTQRGNKSKTKEREEQTENRHINWQS